jgi:hypothetical protein
LEQKVALPYEAETTPQESQRFFMPVSWYKICLARMGLVAVVVAIKCPHSLELSINERKALSAERTMTLFVVAARKVVEFKLHVQAYLSSTGSSAY